MSVATAATFSDSDHSFHASPHRNVPRSAGTERPGAKLLSLRIRLITQIAMNIEIKQK